MGFIQGEARTQGTLFPFTLDELIPEDHVCRVIDAFVSKLEMEELGFVRARPAETGRPPYDPRDLLKLYMYGYLQRIRSSRRLEAECRRNIEVMWLLGRLAPDHKSIAEFRRMQHDAVRMRERSGRNYREGGGSMAKVVFVVGAAFACRDLYASQPQMLISSSSRAIRMSMRGLAFRCSVSHRPSSSVSESSGVESGRRSAADCDRPVSGTPHFAQSTAARGFSCPQMPQEIVASAAAGWLTGRVIGGAPAAPIVGGLGAGLRGAVASRSGGLASRVVGGPHSMAEIRSAMRPRASTSRPSKPREE